MIKLPQEIKERLFNFLLGNISLKEFEAFLSNSKDIEKKFKKDDYFELISLNYNNKNSKHEARKIIEKNIDMSEYEMWKINNILNNIKNKTNNYPECIASLYDLYSGGYYFMENLGLGYGLRLSSTKKYNYDKNFSELDKSEQIKVADKLYPDIMPDILLMQDFLQTKKIILTGKINEFGNYEFLDNRTEKEKVQTEIKKVEIKKKWWQFWK